MPWRVHYTEYERGWGSRPDGHKDFPTEAEALYHQAKYNTTHNSEQVVPDWYIKAEKPVEVKS